MVTYGEVVIATLQWWAALARWCTRRECWGLHRWTSGAVAGVRMERGWEAVARPWGREDDQHSGRVWVRGWSLVGGMRLERTQYYCVHVQGRIPRTGGVGGW